MPEANTIGTCTIEDAEGLRQVEGEDFPLIIGGPEADIRLNGFDVSEPLAYIGLSEGDLFMQPADEGVSQWLEDGDLMRFGDARLAVEMTQDSVRFIVRDALSSDPGAASEAVSGEAVSGEAVSGEAVSGEAVSGEAVSGEAVSGVARVAPIVFEPGQAALGPSRQRGLRPISVLVLFALAALASVAVFVFTSRSIVVQVEPSPDRVAIEDGFVVELGERRLLRPGTYSLAAEKDGYRPLNATLEVTRETNQVFRFELEKLPGYLDIQLEDIPNAEILIDGEVVATTPISTPLEVAPGEHQVLVRARRYKDFDRRIAIEGAGVTQILEVELVALWAPVTFGSKPPGAAVRVAGATVGRTPLTAEVIEGAHVYEFFLAGYKPHHGRLQVTAGEARTVPTVALTPSEGNVVLLAEPDGATVTVNGVYRGQAPIDLRLEPGQPHQVRVSKAGYEPQVSAVEVRSDEARELRVVLAALEGEVRIVSWPPDAELYVNGEQQQKSSGSWRLRAVPHEIEVRKAGYSPYGTTVTPMPGIAQLIEATLETLEQVVVRQTPQVLSSSEGHQLRRVEPGRFLMGASRRVPGRRSNEVLREVELTRAFYLGTQEVSNQQFRQFKKEHLSGQIGGRTLDLNNHPVVRVTWDLVVEYCNWLSAKEGLAPAYVARDGRMNLAEPVTTGYRLPTEAEWTWAARFPGGKPGTKFPWGESLPVNSGSGNYADASAQGVLPAVMTGYNDGFATTAPVESFAAISGFHNLGGNVAEWVHDLYAIRSSGTDKVARDPFGPPDGQFRVIRGSGWMHGSITELRWTYRDYGDQPRPDVGFRLARFAEE